jgi:LysM repeat protein
VYKIYQIEYGDTLDIIANKVNTTVDNLKMINGIDENDIMAGNLIIVPNNTSELFTMYTVKKGDTIYNIAAMYNIDPNTLLKLNGLNKDDYIYPGNELTIPNENVDVYITNENDTVVDVLNNLGVDIMTLARENNKIYVLEDQLMVHKKEINN